MRWLWRICCVLVSTLAAVPAHAIDLNIGLSADISSLDPYYHNIGPNLAVGHHVFDRLVLRDLGAEKRPGLAERWSRLSDTVWEFALRRNVRFHDGSPFTAADVVASLDRIRRITGPAPMAIYVRAIERLEVADAFTIRIHTSSPYPLLLDDISQVPIISAKYALAGTADFDAAAAAVGTGPYRVVRWQRGERLELAAHDGWQGRPHWDRVVLHFLPNDAVRVAALSAGIVDIIDNLPAADLARFRGNPMFDVVLNDTARVLFLRVNYAEHPPGVKDLRGRPLPLNPFRDARVRRALSLAVNRAALRDLVMDGLAKPAGQLVPANYLGASLSLAPQPHDPAAARELLATAGYPDGFAVTLLGPNDRYLNDEALGHAIGRMLSAVGIATDVRTMPAHEFFPRVSRGDFALMLSGWGSSTGEASYALKGLLARHDPARGWGNANHGRYANPRFDALLEQAVATLADDDRHRLLAAAMDLAMEETALIPIHFQMRAVAMRRPLAYHPSKDEAVLAVDVKPGF